MKKELSYCYQINQGLFLYRSWISINWSISLTPWSFASSFAFHPKLSIMLISAPLASKTFTNSTLLFRIAVNNGVAPYPSKQFTSNTLGSSLVLSFACPDAILCNILLSRKSKRNTYIHFRVNHVHDIMKIFRTISRIKRFNTEKYTLYLDKKLQIAPYRGSDILSKRTEIIKKIQTQEQVSIVRSQIERIKRQI